MDPIWDPNIDLEGMSVVRVQAFAFDVTMQRYSFFEIISRSHYQNFTFMQRQSVVYIYPLLFYWVALFSPNVSTIPWN